MASSSEGGLEGEKNDKFCFKQKLSIAGMTRNILWLNSLAYVSGYFFQYVYFHQ